MRHFKVSDKLSEVCRHSISALRRTVRLCNKELIIIVHPTARLGQSLLPCNQIKLPQEVRQCFFGNRQNTIIGFCRCHFRNGLCSRRQNGVIRDLDWKKTFIVKSVQFQRDVIPVHFEGRNSDFFYNLANLCKVLGIKFNIAMLYLADEMLKNRHKTFTVTFGKPIPWQTFDKSKTPAEWAQYVKDIVYKL